MKILIGLLIIQFSAWAQTKTFSRKIYKQDLQRCIDGVKKDIWMYENSYDKTCRVVELPQFNSTMTRCWVKANCKSR